MYKIMVMGPNGLQELELGTNLGIGPNGNGLEELRTNQISQFGSTFGLAQPSPVLPEPAALPPAPRTPLAVVNTNTTAQAQSSGSGSAKRREGHIWPTNFTLMPGALRPAIASRIASPEAEARDGDVAALISAIHLTMVDKYDIIYPRALVYDLAARWALEHFPALAGLHDGQTEDLLREKLMHRFRNERKRHGREDSRVAKRLLGPSKRAKTGNCESRSKRGHAHGIENYKPSRPETEDDASISRHLNALKDEGRKREPNLPLVDARMTATFADRRRDVLSGMSVPDVLDQYWPLQSYDGLLREMKRLHPPFCLDRLEDRIKRLQTLPEFRRSPLSGFRKKLEQDDENPTLAENTLEFARALAAVPGLLRESLDELVREEEDPGKATYILATELRKPGFLTVREYTAKVEGVAFLQTSSLMKAFVALFLSYYIFDMEYPNYASKTLLWFQLDVAGIPARLTKKMNDVKQLILKLNRVKV